MNREQMIRAAADALHRYCGCGRPGHADVGIYDEAIDVVDAILPQVTTVEELEALPDGTVVLDCEGLPYRAVTEDQRYWNDTEDECESSKGLAVWRGPLTVVWQP